MPNRVAVASPTMSPQAQRNRPDSFCKYRSQVAELLSQGERISHHDQQATDRYSNSAVGAEMSNLEKENLNVLLRQCVRDLTTEVDEMRQRICSMQLISKLGNKCLSSSPTTLEPEEYGEANLETMQQQLEKLLDDVVTTCRPMTRGEIRELQKSIKKLPETNLKRVAEIVGNHHITSGKDFKDEIIVSLEQADNIMLWRLHFYVGAVKSAQNLVN